MKIELTQQEWQNVLAIMARAPFNEVAPLIQKIAEQLQAPRPAEIPQAADRPHFREMNSASD